MVLIGAAFGAIAWRCRHDPDLMFLPRDHQAEWIRFPTAVDARAHNIASLDATFRREFTLRGRPRTAHFAVRAAKRIDLQINGARIELPATRNWKSVSIAAVGDFLRAGTNTIEARVFNDNGPPALWLVLGTDELTLRSDASWDASFSGSAWRKAVLASAPILPGRGNAISGSEQTAHVFKDVWPVWLVFAGMAAAAMIGIRLAVRRRRAFGQSLRQAKTIGPLLLATGLWLILFWHNTATLPFRVGFDSEAHLNYIKYIQERGALPLPNEGFEMFQPPLYYIISAVALSAFRLTTGDNSAILLLRALTMFFGVAHFVLVFLALGSLFPNRTARQLVGLALAAFLPMQLYLSHFVTNETLAAVLVTAALYVAILIFNRPVPSAALYSVLGFLLGAAVLTKTTAILLMPPLFFGCALHLAQRRASLPVWARTVGLMIVICLAVCGWHYVRIWRHFATPIVGNWEPVSGFAWWQDPGYHTLGDYLRFGRSLVAPFFSGFAGFADGVYSTLWGDGLCGGNAELSSRLPWNYKLMVGGYILALVPSGLIMIGGVLAIRRALVNPTPAWWLLLGYSAMIVLALIFMSLRVASYAQVKAFYGLSALVPFCAFAAIGWDTLTRRKFVRIAFAAGLLLWALNSYAAFWIPRGASQHAYAALRFSIQDKIDIAQREAARAVQTDSLSALARARHAAILGQLGRGSEALAEAQKALEVTPVDSAAHLQLAILLHEQKQTGRAIEEAQRAIELGPETKFAHNLLALSLLESQRNEDASAIAREGLASFPFDAELHYLLGLATAAHGDPVTATTQFAYALLLRKNWQAAAAKLSESLNRLVSGREAPGRLRQAAASAPDLPEALDQVAWLLATHPDDLLRDGSQSLRLARRACALTSRKEPVLLATLAAAYAESGRFADAIATAREAFALAQASGDSDAALTAQNLLTEFQANRPYRNAPR